MKSLARPCLIFLIALTAWAGPSALPAARELSREAVNESKWEDLAFRIDDSRSYVGIAAVNLSVSELRPENGNLVGEYSITVPMMRSKNDSGRIILPLDQNVGALGKTGGVLRGNAYSDKENEAPNGIVCEILPDENQKIVLAITTKERTLRFTSNYVVIESSKGS